MFRIIHTFLVNTKNLLVFKYQSFFLPFNLKHFFKKATNRFFYFTKLHMATNFKIKSIKNITVADLVVPVSVRSGSVPKTIGRH